MMVITDWVTAVGTYNCNLAKYLAEIFTPLFSTEKQYMLKDTFDFVNKVSKIQSTEDQYSVIFDVELFSQTNIPTKETIDILLNRAFTDNTKYFNGMTRETVENLLIICAQESHFQFNKKFYDQIDVMAISWIIVRQRLHGRVREQTHGETQRARSTIIA